MKYKIEIEKSGIILILGEVKSEKELKYFLDDFENETTITNGHTSKTITPQENSRYIVQYHMEGFYLSHPDDFLSLIYGLMRLKGWR